MRGFAAEEAGWLQRLARVLYAPQASFAAVAGRESALDWLVPVFIASAVGLGCHYLTMDAVGDMEAVQEKLRAMDEAQRQQYEQSIEMLRLHGWAMIPVGLFTSLVIVGGVLMLVGRWGFRSELSFRQALVIKGYATLVVVPEWVVRTLFILGTGAPHAGLGALLGEEAAATFAGRVLAGISIFDLWQLGVMAAGLALLGDIERRHALLALLGLWLAWLLSGAALAGAPPAAPPTGPP